MAHTILIVDDSPTAAPELKALLERDGYHVLVALRGEEALDMLRNDKIDLVITEALLPTMDGFELVRQIRELPQGGQVPVMMVTVKSAPEDYAASFAAGANEYFPKPIEPPKLLAAVKGLIIRYESGRLEHPMVPARVAGATGLPSRAERGQVITVYSLKGGVGTTTIAVNLAVAIKQAEPSARVGIIDLSLEDGHVAMLLDIVPTSTIVDWARENMQEVTPHLLNQYFVQHRSGISVLSAPMSPEQAEIVRPPVVRKTMELAPLAFDYTIVDTASNFTESTLIALEMANSILMPITPDMAAMKSAVNTMRVLDAVKIKKERIRIVQNEIVPRAGLTRDQMEAGLGKDIVSIPHGGAAVVEAANQGIPLVTIEPPGVAARAIIETARSMCLPETEEATAKQGANSLVGRLRQFRRA